MTLRDGLYYGEKVLKDAGVTEYKQDAWILFSAVIKMDSAGYLARQDEEFYEESKENYRSFLKKRIEHIPVQYILGVQSFMGHTFKVSTDTLIPRIDTETLVEEALRVVGDQDTILDMCTGTGCILISILKERPQAFGRGVDISRQAVNLARQNAELNGVTAEFETGDMFEKISDEYDVIVCNPPYIAASDMQNLMPEVRDYEPESALNGGADGLDFYRIIAKDSPAHLKEGGIILLEIGYNQAYDVERILSKAGFTDIKVIKDLSGNDRVVKAVRSSNV